MISELAFEKRSAVAVSRTVRTMVGFYPCSYILGIYGAPVTSECFLCRCVDIGTRAYNGGGLGRVSSARRMQARTYRRPHTRSLCRRLPSTSSFLFVQSAQSRILSSGNGPTMSSKRHAPTADPSSSKHTATPSKKKSTKRPQHKQHPTQPSSSSSAALPGVQKIKAALRQTRRLLAKDTQIGRAHV